MKNVTLILVIWVTPLLNSCIVVYPKEHKEIAVEEMMERAVQNDKGRIRIITKEDNKYIFRSIRKDEEGNYIGISNLNRKQLKINLESVGYVALENRKATKLVTAVVYGVPGLFLLAILSLEWYNSNIIE